MKRGPFNYSRKSQAARLRNAYRGFTLIELAVIVAILALLSTMLLPALCQTKSPSRTIACRANFRQWAVAANLYAKDNSEWLPGADGAVAGGGMYVWEMPTNMCNVLGRYGVDVPQWFCPVRPDERATANSWAFATFGHPISTVDELKAYFSRTYPGLLVSNHNWWIPRRQGTTSFPTDYSKAPFIAPWLREAESTKYGWPRKLHDVAAAHVPFISDKCGSGNGNGFLPSASGNVSFQPDDISPNTAHFVNGELIGVNAAFADGRVESHSKAQIRAVYASPGGNTYWFY
jgi:prepilin-type processing-associated H-X9-DG protein